MELYFVIKLKCSFFIKQKLDKIIMLSYRHAFHAGNHADILKHFILFLILHYYNKKDKPYFYIDTHSGAGLLFNKRTISKNK